MEAACPNCDKFVPEGNSELHSLRCSKVKASETKDSVGKKGRESKPSAAQTKKHQSVKSNESEDLDAMLAEMTLMDSSCAFKGCKKKVNILGLQCRFCSRRFCMEHNIPEVHGCAEAAKKHARQAHKHKPISSSNDAKRTHLQRKLGSKLEELSSERQSKSRGKSKKWKLTVIGAQLVKEEEHRTGLAA